MKIETRFYLSHVVNIGLIILIAAFSLQNFYQILTKLKFTEFADDLNATFLELRLSEKNYFLYGDNNVLLEIENKIKTTDLTLDRERENISRAIGDTKFGQLQQLLVIYREHISDIRRGNKKDERSRQELREAGQRLKIFSEKTTALEREQVSTIIDRTATLLRYSFLGVGLLAFLFSMFSGRSIRSSLRRIVALTQAISKGNYQRIDEAQSSDEMGSVILAINTMAEELKRREQEIVQSKRLASIGILVAGVAHELNNPLNNISMIAQTYTEVYDHLDKEQRIGFMEQIDEQTERLRVTIRNLLDYSKPKEQHLEEVHPNDVIQKALSLVQNMLNISSIKIKLDLAEGLPSLYIDDHQIQQVLVNMELNAIQAMGPGGELTLSTRYYQERDEVDITIRDTGKGIPQELLEHIFDPFFTTKGDSGTGLGLWVSYGIIKNHGGTVHVESTVGQGTAFTIILPTCKKLKRCPDVT
jgi:two-component system NtrC family sensor kinase